MDKGRAKSRRVRISTVEEGEKYYSALGGEPSFTRSYLEDLKHPTTPDRVRFKSPESIPLAEFPFQNSEDLNTDFRFYARDDNHTIIKTENKRRSQANHNIFESLEEWELSEISIALQGLSNLEVQILEASWRGQMDHLHDAILNVKEANVYGIINCHDSMGRTPLHFASAFGHSQIAQILLQNGALVNVWDRKKKATPLGCACACGSLAVVEILLAHKADVNAGLGGTLTPLHWSIRSGSTDCLKKLLSSGANPNSFTVEVGTALHLAASLSDEKCMSLLLEYNVNVDVYRGSEQWTALHIAANEGSEACIELLLKAGAKIDMRDARDQTPLHIAATNGDSETTAFLLTYKANPGARDTDGRTPLHKAVSKGNECVECMLPLLEYAAEIDSQDNFGFTPLHLAATNDSALSAAYLLQHGADVTIRTKTGQSALSLLVKKMPHVIRHVRESLDNAVTINHVDPTDPECELKLDFRAIIANPLSKSLSKSQRSKNFRSEHHQRLAEDDMQKETEFLNCLINTGHKTYLLHPLIEAFIVLKWRRVRFFFWISLAFYATMVLVYSIYVYEVYMSKCPFNIPNFLNVTDSKRLKCLPKNALSGNATVREQIARNSIHCDLTEVIELKVIWAILATSSMIVTLKELFQMLQSFRAYLMAIEHYFQWLLLGTIYVALSPVPMTGICLAHWQYPSAAIGILAAWSLMLVRIGRFPSLGLYIQILAKVIRNFGLFISAYASLIIAFALAFKILFPEEPAFGTIPRSIMKTVTMMVGDLTYDELFYENQKEGRRDQEMKPLFYPITAHIVFASFVIFITIILMNLLVGLAVNDIQSLEKGAKVERLLRQTSSISGLESFLFSKPLHALLPKSIGNFLQKRALLVPSSYKWTFYFRPNDPRDHRLPKEIIREALCLASNRQKLTKLPAFGKLKQNTQRIHNPNAQIEKYLEDMERRLHENFRKDLDTIINQIQALFPASK